MSARLPIRRRTTRTASGARWSSTASCDRFCDLAVRDRSANGRAVFVDGLWAAACSWLIHLTAGGSVTRPSRARRALSARSLTRANGDTPMHSAGGSPTVSPRLQRSSSTPLRGGVVALLVISLLAEVVVVSVRAANPDRGRDGAGLPTIHYEEALAHAADRIAFAP